MLYPLFFELWSLWNPFSSIKQQLKKLSRTQSICAQLHKLNATYHGNKFICLQGLFTVCPYSVDGLPGWISLVRCESVWWPLRIPSWAAFFPHGVPKSSEHTQLCEAARVTVRMAFAISCLNKSLIDLKSMTGWGFRIMTALEIKTRALNCQLWNGSPWKFWSALLWWPVPTAAHWAKHVKSHKDTASALRSLTLGNYALCELKRQQLLEVCWS